jgi:hypothetical protein
MKLGIVKLLKLDKGRRLLGFFHQGNYIFWVSSIFLVLGTLGTIWVAHIADERISDNELKTAEANQKAAEANQRAEELKKKNLELQTVLTPRRIAMVSRNGDQEKRAEFFAKLKEFSGTIAFIQAVPDFEAQTLAKDVYFVLKDSGWTPQILDSTTLPNVSPGIISEGVGVITLEEPIFPPKEGYAFSQAAKAGQALENLLRLDLSGNNPFWGVHWNPEYVDFAGSISDLKKRGLDLPKGAVLILVGLRPLTTSMPN